MRLRMTCERVCAAVRRVGLRCSPGSTGGAEKYIYFGVIHLQNETHESALTYKSTVHMHHRSQSPAKSKKPCFSNFIYRPLSILGLFSRPCGAGLRGNTHTLESCTRTQRASVSSDTACTRPAHARRAAVAAARARERLTVTLVSACRRCSSPAVGMSMPEARTRVTPFDC